MSDQDNLRNRIETVLDRFTGESWEHHHKNAAQAIIDELGLTVETVEGVMDPKGDYDAARVVGKWAKR